MAARVKWKAPHPGSSAILSYKVQRKRGTGTWADLVTLAIGNPSLTDYGTGVEYRYGYLDTASQPGDLYRVSALNAIGEGLPSSGVSYVPPLPPAERLRWAPPDVAYTVLHISNASLGTGDLRTVTLTAGKDYHLIFDDVMPRRVIISGGRHVKIIGAEWYVEAGALRTQFPVTQRSRYDNLAALEFKGQTGVVHLEGIKIWGPYASGEIRIPSGGGAATYQVQKVLSICDRIFPGVTEVADGYYHTDFWQSWGGLAGLLMDWVTAKNPFQVAMIGDGALSATWGPTTFGRVNWRPGPTVGQVTKLVNWVTNATYLKGPFVFEKDKVFLDPGATPWNTVFAAPSHPYQGGALFSKTPPGTDSAGRQYAHNDPTKITGTLGITDGEGGPARFWRGLPTVNGVQRDYVLPEEVGKDYVSPGYVTDPVVDPAVKLTWRPRTTFTNTIDLDTTDTRTFVGSSTQHLKVIGRAGAIDTRRGLFFQGWGSVTVIGGHYKPSAKALYPAGGTVSGGSITFFQCGEAYVEGICIDNATVGAYDGIQVVAKTALTKIVVQNSRFQNVQGTEAGEHGDLFQTGSSNAGQSDYVRFDRFTGTCNYQGFFLDPQDGGGIRSIDLRRVNVRHTAATGAKMFFWFYRDVRYLTPVTLEDVWGNPDAGDGIEDEVWPPTNAHLLTDRFSSSKYNAVRATDPATGRVGVHWPGLTDPGKVFKGYVFEGAPPGGDFVPSVDPRTGKVWGLDYVSPGYV